MTTKSITFCVTFKTLRFDNDEALRKISEIVGERLNECAPGSDTETLGESLGISYIDDDNGDEVYCP